MSKDNELAVEVAEEGNLKLWRSVETTDPAMTTPVGYGKRKFTTVDPQYQLLQATKLWGPYGNRWGLRNIKYQILEVRGNDKVVLETRDKEGNLVQSCEQMADYIKYSIIVEAEFFYPFNGQTVAFPILNDDKYLVDDDTLKKVLTNTRSKALSYLGFAADVFLGKFDDTKYVERTRDATAKRNAFVNEVISKIVVADTLEKIAEYDSKIDDVKAQSKLNAIDEQECRELLEERRQYLLKKMVQQ